MPDNPSNTYIFDTTIKEIELPQSYKIVDRNARLAQTRVLDVHYRFETDMYTDYVAVFEVVQGEVGIIKITIITYKCIPIPALSYRILGGPRHSLPAGTQYPHTTTYPHIYLICPNTERISVIPRVIVQTWRSRYVTPGMAYTINAIIALNPEYDYVMFDDTAAAAFISTNFNSVVVHAYQSLRIGTFRADLFRYCYLYINGGVYIDTKAVSVVPLYVFLGFATPMVLIEEVFPCGISTTIIASPPFNPLFKLLIQRIIQQILLRDKGLDYWDLTGPRAFARAFNVCINVDENKQNPLEEFSQLCRLRNCRVNNSLQVQTRGGRILFHKAYSTYYSNDNHIHYTRLWDANTVFFTHHPTISDFEMSSVNSTSLLLGDEGDLSSLL